MPYRQKDNDIRLHRIIDRFARWFVHLFRFCFSILPIVWLQNYHTWIRTRKFALWVRSSKDLIIATNLCGLWFEALKSINAMSLCLLLWCCHLTKSTLCVHFPNWCARGFGHLQKISRKCSYKKIFWLGANYWLEGHEKNYKTENII